MRIRRSIYIDRPTAEVFAYISDPVNDITWRSELMSSRVVGDIQEGVGTHLRQTLSHQGRVADASLEVTEFEPGERICFRAHGGVRAHGCYHLRPDGDGTALAVSVTVELKGAAAMLERYLSQAVEQAIRTDLERLRALLEAARTPG